MPGPGGLGLKVEGAGGSSVLENASRSGGTGAAQELS